MRVPSLLMGTVFLASGNARSQALDATLWNMPVSDICRAAYL
ncbi:hypothetical protein NBRC3278_3224 [Acetobacter pasteurianus NBRC 3278]|uniref:Uncharacterized protein n=1 Tax=Acetobacter pasteurianus NBRC 3278 TaxID=1226660 RepID=A0A401X893_ACEPA|nr:hypothetical protein NBRC3277_3253 [Acetobacter pasteurianus NBRC 3277]GCD64131.1 hypothetical protein NBRC3278_3224 [Acetobacter pasteurianus NBRC 3278]